MADDETLDAMGIESGYDLTGLYRGTPMPLASATNPSPEPDMILLLPGNRSCWSGSRPGKIWPRW